MLNLTKGGFPFQQQLLLMEAEKDIKCGFCHLGVEAEPVCGKLHHDNKNTSAHHKCMVGRTQ